VNRAGAKSRNTPVTGTVLLSMIQGFGIAFGLQQMAGPSGAPIVLNPGIGFVLMTMITLTSGTAFIMWLGEVITEKASVTAYR